MNIDLQNTKVEVTLTLPNGSKEHILIDDEGDLYGFGWSSRLELVDGTADTSVDDDKVRKALVTAVKSFIREARTLGGQQT